MDSGKILIGIALVMFSAALMVSPSSAAGFNASRQVGNGSAITIAGEAITTDAPLSSGAAGRPVISPDQAVAGMTTRDRLPVPETNRVSGCLQTGI